MNGRIFLKSKIHRATVTDANLAYEGSLTLDPGLMEAARLDPYEQVHVLNLNTGSRLETYVIPGKRGAGDVCLNGAAARLGQKGDAVLVLSYAVMDPPPGASYAPDVVRVDAFNRVIEVRKGG